MKRWSALILTLLVACAPAPTGRAPVSASPAPALPFQADFSDAGVTWVAGGKAYVARAPNLRPLLSPLPTPAVAAAWVGNVAWGALPGPGIIVTLDGPPETRVVGRVIRLSRQRLYLQDGSVLTYTGTPAGSVPGTPDMVLTGGDGEDYALVGGELYRPGQPPTRLTPARLPAGSGFLYRLPGRGAAVAERPSVQTDQGLYQLSGRALERLGSGGEVIASLPHGPGLIGEVGGRLVTLSAEGQLRVFTPDLREVRP
ncbi:hypothetical protein DKM44_08705 [Deinococcus irradiatisoli]|uniref:Uncharacterized protein n=1 Tax=Deinococcus irradiatisoli TaxID=2202254 RepID=A0A2Z3JK69_9DEIO|nr:hypothetical protein [Deinococcus irradiatisoli]AWN23299.1 hypothetical protein DKM44_08705 [Deinococcus irradiatisoli]